LELVFSKCSKLSHLIYPGMLIRPEVSRPRPETCKAKAENVKIKKFGLKAKARAKD